MCTFKVSIGDQELEITLTPKCYLNRKSLQQREKFECIDDTEKERYLELVHEEDNKYDSKAIAVYSEDIHIGYIQKRFTDRDVSFEVESFFYPASILISSAKK